MHPPATAARAPAVHERVYPAESRQIRAVRADLRRLLADCPAAEEVVLCASELATNAALHSDSRQPGGEFTVRAQIHRGYRVTIEVEDSGGVWAGLPALDDRPHGLDIIRALAAECGVRLNQSGRTVWVRLDWLRPD